MAKRYNKALDLDSMKRAYDSCFYKHYKTFDDYAEQFLSKDKKLSFNEAYTLLSHIQKELEDREHPNGTDIGMGVIINALDTGKIKVVKIEDGSYRRNRIFYHPRREYPLKSKDGSPAMNTIDFEVDQYNSNSCVNHDVDPFSVASKMVARYKTIYVQIDNEDSDIYTLRR